MMKIPWTKAGISAMKPQIQSNFMANEQLKQLIKNGLAAMKTGSEMAAKATDEINNAATDPKLKESLKKGNETSKKWSERIAKGLMEAGSTETRENPIIEGIDKVNSEILSSAPDAYSRDLGIIAGGQLAIHYWIGAFGTMASYTEEAGLSETQKAMKLCVEEAKQADEEQTKIAKEMMQRA